MFPTRRGALLGKRLHCRYGGSLVKNRYLEDWNGMREVSEKKFKLTANETVPQVFGWLVIPFVAIYCIGKADSEKTDKFKGLPDDKDRYL